MSVQWASVETSAPFLRYPCFAPEEIEKGIFRFLNRTVDLKGRIDWSAPETDRLWIYNLHYFHYLPGTLEAGAGFRLISDWIRHNPPGTKDSWDPFPISLRLVNWIKFLTDISSAETLPGEVLGSAHLQALWLERSLEYRLLGNHLFKNAKALVFCGLFFRGDDAKRWLAKGTAILKRELEEQILPDGGHFERSPMYHSMILEDCLDLLNISTNREDKALRELSGMLRERIPSMMEFLIGMTHPDGQIALFNDAAFGIEAAPAQLAGYYQEVFGEAAPALLDSSRSFSHSGYFVMSPRPGERMIIDAGPIGPDYQPGHAHSDTLSFELSIEGHRVVVDSGCFQYEDGPIRRYNRGNAGHNTVTIDGRNQSEVWGAHRCARRARPLHAEIEQKGGDIIFRGAHDGYRRLKGKPVHHRQVVRTGRSYFIEDRVEGDGAHRVESRLHIHPDLDLDWTSDEVAVKCKGEFLAAISSVQGQVIEKEEGWYCPEFGVKRPCSVLKISLPEAALPCRTGWVIRT